MQKEQQISDQELVQAVLNGDTKYYAEIVKRYQQLVANICYKLAGNKIDVEEVVQTVFVELYFSLPRFRFQAKLSTYIYRIALNIITKTLNKVNRYEQWNDKLDDVLHSPSIYDEVVKDESTQELHRAIDKLKYEQRVALTLHYFDDMSYKEVAEVMEVSLSKVETGICTSYPTPPQSMTHEVKELSTNVPESLAIIFQALFFERITFRYQERYQQI